MNKCHNIERLKRKVPKHMPENVGKHGRRGTGQSEVNE
jgi:hypothetical protein